MERYKKVKKTEVKMVEEFRYFGPTVYSNRERGKEVKKPC